MVLLVAGIVKGLLLLIEMMNISTSSLHGNIVGFDYFLFNAKTRKRLNKEAEYYQLEGIKNILAFKSSSVETEHDCDYM